MSNNGYTTGENLLEFKESVLEDLGQGYDLVDVAYGDGSWVGVYQDTPKNTGYYAASSAEELTQTVQQQWEEGGYRLTDVEYGDGVWFGTFEEDYGANTYSISTSLTELTEDISEVWNWNKGYDLVDVEYGDGIWFGVFQDDYSITSGYVNGSTFDELLADGKELFSQGYELVDVEYGDGIWFGTIEKQVDTGFYNNFLDSQMKLLEISFEPDFLLNGF